MDFLSLFGETTISEGGEEKAKSCKTAAVARLPRHLVTERLSMQHAISAWRLRTSDKTLKQLLSYLLLWEKSLWPH